MCTSFGTIFVRLNKSIILAYIIYLDMPSIYVPLYLDSCVNTFKVGPDEADRISALHYQGILDSKPSERFDRISSLLSRVLKSPLAVITFVDSERTWIKSSIGLDNLSEVHRNQSLCSHAILPNAPDVTAVIDTIADPVYCSHPVVTGPPYIRFYAAAPIKITYNDNVFNLGTVCVASTEPQTKFDLRDKQFLLDMASIAADEIELHRALCHRGMDENQRYIKCTPNNLEESVQDLRSSIGLLKDHLTEQQQEQSDLFTSGNSGDMNANCTRLLQQNSTEPSGTLFAKMREQLLPGWSSANLSSSRSTSAAATTKVESIINLVMQVESACNVMTKTLSNCVHTPHAEKRGSEDSDSPSGDGAFVEECRINSGVSEHNLEGIDAAELVRDCRCLNEWHRCNYFKWAEEVGPEVNCALIMPHKSILTS